MLCVEIGGWSQTCGCTCPSMQLAARRTRRGAHRRCVRTARRQAGSARWVATSAALDARDAGEAAAAAMPSMQKRTSSSAAGRMK